MNTEALTVALGNRSYPIHVGSDLLDGAATLLSLESRPMLMLSDTNVAPLYAERVATALGLAPTALLVVPAGEGSKSMDVLNRVLDWMLDQRLPRDGVLIALGGGVVGDLGGFAAAVYQRGIDFVQCPTTLLAMVDSSVGGKTGINHVRGKNLIGAFHQPIAVFADTDTLNTLPEREFGAGLAEVYKYALLGDAAFLDWLDRHADALRQLDPSAVDEVVRRCCRMKAEIVARDEREAGQRALLNLGHSFGHAIEAFEQYRGYLHGEAVAVGMRIAAAVSVRLGMLDAAAGERIGESLDRAGLPAAVPSGMDVDDFARLMALDKKVRDGRLRLILLRGIGEAVVSADFDDEIVFAELARCCRRERA